MQQGQGGLKGATVAEISLEGPCERIKVEREERSRQDEHSCRFLAQRENGRAGV